ncbi:MAG: type I-C CRISPR-associated protein Cas8c/Csd1 [Butyrivibrio sp.]|nr:type I-C CRISPR-associated protein Cas8c/Csd1 [Butyrivibrio sp.]
MYASIYRYAKEHDLAPVHYRVKRKLAAYLCIDGDGIYDRLDIVKNADYRVMCPDIGKNRAASGTNANMICNKKEYIFCVPDGKGGMTGNVNKHTGWMDITREGARYSSTLKSIWQFCQKIEADKTLYERIEKELFEAGIKKTDFLSFRINGKKAEECHDWEKWFDKRMSILEAQSRQETAVGISLITGEAIIPIQGNEKFPQIMTKQTVTGSPIYSCAHKTVSGNACAFTSYGVVNSLGSPMSIEEAEAIKAGLEFLLESSKNHSDDFNIIYWFDDDNAENLIGLSIKGAFEDDEDDKEDGEQASVEEAAYAKLLEAVKKGKVPENRIDRGDYHIIHFEVPAKGRFYLNGEKKGKYSDLYQNLYHWYEDSAITTDKQRYLTKLYGVLFGLLEHKGTRDVFKEIKIEYGTDRDRLLEAIHENGQIPMKFFEKALKQVIRVYLNNPQSDNGKAIKREVNWPVPMQIIKVYLIRSGKENYRMDAIDLESTSVAYNCGRLLAAINRLQMTSADKNVNLTIGQKYFRAASKTPGKIMIMALANKENYLKRLKKEGTRIYFIRLLGEISGKIGTTIPETFSKKEQGEFMLGYFYQENEFYKRAEINDKGEEKEGEE